MGWHTRRSIQLWQVGRQNDFGVENGQTTSKHPKLFSGSWTVSKLPLEDDAYQRDLYVKRWLSTPCIPKEEKVATKKVENFFDEKSEASCVSKKTNKTTGAKLWTNTALHATSNFFQDRIAPDIAWRTTKASKWLSLSTMSLVLIAKKVSNFKIWWPKLANGGKRQSIRMFLTINYYCRWVAFCCQTQQQD